MDAGQESPDRWRFSLQAGHTHALQMIPNECKECNETRKRPIRFLEKALYLAPVRAGSSRLVTGAHAWPFPSKESFP
jgi:hypothetical protein